MKKLIQYLKQPYPVSENSWRTILFISIFVSLFLIIFHPFGSEGIKQNLRNWILAGYGGVTFIVLVIDLILIPLLFSKQFAEVKWNLGKQIIWLLWILFSIGLGNYWYTQFLFANKTFVIKGFLIMQTVTFLVGIFPIVLFSIMNYNRLLRKNLLQASVLDAQILAKPINEPSENRLVIFAENEKNKLSLTDNQLIFISSEGNYSTVYYKHESHIKKTVIRSTLKRIEDQIRSNPKLFRCHRAFIVNIQHIEKISGNSQGLQLKLSGDIDVPVSRNFTKELKERIQQLG